MEASLSAYEGMKVPAPWLPFSAAAAAKSLQSCPTLCYPIDGSPPGSAVPRILQARTLEWVAISFSSAWKWKVKVKSLSRVWLLATPWAAAYQAPPSMGFSRQEYWSGCCCLLWPLLNWERKIGHASLLPCKASSLCSSPGFADGQEHIFSFSWCVWLK